jgi:hypothetical protein
VKHPGQASKCSGFCTSSSDVRISDFLGGCVSYRGWRGGRPGSRPANPSTVLNLLSSGPARGCAAIAVTQAPHEPTRCRLSANTERPTRSHDGSAPISRPASRSPWDRAIHRHTGDDHGPADLARETHARHGRSSQSQDCSGSPDRDMDELGHRAAGRQLGGARRAGGLGGD